MTVHMKNSKTLKYVPEGSLKNIVHFVSSRTPPRPSNPSCKHNDMLDEQYSREMTSYQGRSAGISPTGHPVVPYEIRVCPCACSSGPRSGTRCDQEAVLDVTKKRYSM
eukprot:2140212-Pyramimonas_sp.AAC.2